MLKASSDVRGDSNVPQTMSKMRGDSGDRKGGPQMSFNVLVNSEDVSQTLSKVFGS